MTKPWEFEVQIAGALVFVTTVASKNQRATGMHACCAAVDGLGSPAVIRQRSKTALTWSYWTYAPGDRWALLAKPDVWLTGKPVSL